VRDVTTGDLPGLGWTGGHLHRDYIIGMLTLAGNGEADYLAVCGPDGGPDGLGAVEYTASSGVPWMCMVQVSPQAQGRGAATALITALEHRARARGYLQVELGVEPDNVRADRLYRHLGYEQVRTERRSWQEAGPGGPPVTRNVTVLVLRKLLAR